MIVNFSHEEMSPDILHKIVCANFQDRSKVIASLITGDNALVKCLLAPSGDHTKLYNRVSSFQNSNQVKIYSHVAFCNRGNSGLAQYRLNRDRALEKFCSDSGLKNVDGWSQFLGPISAGKFSIQNAFLISGTFEVENEELFNSKVSSGIGSRRGYGFGLILAKSKE